MKKNWNNPELKNLGVSETNEEGCVYEAEALNTPTPMTSSPVYVWGDGKIGCTYWNCDKKGCEHPQYGKGSLRWPCPPVPVVTPVS